MTTPNSLLVHGPRYSGDPKEVKHVWLDVDNTLVENNSPELPTNEFIDTAHSAGEIAMLGLATARPLSKAEHIIKAAKLEGISILSNGGQIIDTKTGELTERSLPVSVATEIALSLQELNVTHWIQDNGNDHFWLEDEIPVRNGQKNTGLGAYASSKTTWLPVSKENNLVVPSYEPSKPFVVVAHDVSAEDVGVMQEIADQYSNHHVTSLVAHENQKPNGSKSYEVFFLDDRANKRTALDVVIEKLGVPREQTMAVGDGPNDTALLEAAGTGVAMGNAVEATKQTATHIAPHFRDHGAEIALRELVIKG